MFDNIILTRAGVVATLTLNRPQKLNAINYALRDELCRALDLLEEDAEIRVVVLTGAGSRAFSAGADIPQFVESMQQGTALREFVRRGQAMTSRIESFGKPLITAVNGLAYGGGCEIVEASHLSVASETATFSKPEVRIGIPPTFGGTQRLTRLAGRKTALRFLLSGEAFSAEVARALGLVNEVVAQDRVLARAHDLATAIAKHPPRTVSAILQAATRGLNASISEGLALEAAAFSAVADTQDTHRSLAAWMSRKE